MNAWVNTRIFHLSYIQFFPEIPASLLHILYSSLGLSAINKNNYKNYNSNSVYSRSCLGYLEVS